MKITVYVDAQPVTFEIHTTGLKAGDIMAFGFQVSCPSKVGETMRGDDPFLVRAFELLDLVSVDGDKVALDKDCDTLEHKKNDT